MKLTCGIVMDLLPLYEEGICSEETREAVEVHLKECHTCRSFLEDVQSFPKEEKSLKEEKTAEADKAVAKSFRKVKKHWLLSLIVVILLIPACYLGWNEAHKTGVHFTNIRELYIGNQFVKALQEEDYDKAFQYLDLRPFNSLGKKKSENFEDKARESFNESAELLRKAGGVEKFEYRGVVAHEYASGFIYELEYKLLVDGKWYRTTFDISDNGVSNFSTSYSFWDEPISHLGAWSEWLWQDLNGCYFDFEAKEYVYY